jgi:hypothetical protein
MSSPPRRIMGNAISSKVPFFLLGSAATVKAANKGRETPPPSPLNDAWRCLPCLVILDGSCIVHVSNNERHQHGPRGLVITNDQVPSGMQVLVLLPLYHASS